MNMHECFQRERISKLEDKTNKMCEFKGGVESDIKTIFNLIEDIKNNHLRHLNRKINALLFTVLGSVFATILIGLIKWLILKG